MPYVNFKVETDADGIALVTWDSPGRSMNVIDLKVIEELGAIVEQVTADGAIKGAIITSGKETFCAGARQLPLLMGLTPGSECARQNRRSLDALRTFDGPLLTAFSDGDPATQGWEAVLRGAAPGAAGQAHIAIEGAGHFLQEDKGPELGRAIANFVTAPPR